MFAKLSHHEFVKKFITMLKAEEENVPLYVYHVALLVSLIIISLVSVIITFVCSANFATLCQMHA